MEQYRGKLYPKNGRVKVIFKIFTNLTVPIAQVFNISKSLLNISMTTGGMKKLHKKNIGHLIGHVIYIVLYGVLIVSAIFLYNSASLAKLLYAGWMVLALGIIFLVWSAKSRRRGYAENTCGEVLVESGMYAFVRHPEFLGHILTILALVIISQHWISLIAGAILIVLLYLAMIEEEKRNMEKFGEMYRDYMKKVPRINLIAGIIRQIHSKRDA